MAGRFLLQVHLRTTDVGSARAFYADVLGDVALEIFPLHERALARGARPHWLGYIEVEDVDAGAAAFVQRGATAFGRWNNAQGLEAAVLRDPGGAVIALGRLSPGGPGTAGRTAPAWASGPRVLAYELDTPDVERAKANYGALCGWDFSAPVDLGPLGVIHPFAWERGGAQVGFLRDIAAHPGVHPHWLFHFQVPSVDRAVESVRAASGIVLGPFRLPGGERVAICDDAQGAAFALRDDPTAA